MSQPDLPAGNVAHALSAGLYNGCCFISHFIFSVVRPRIAPAASAKEGEASDATRMLVGQLIRISEWLRSFAKLNSPDDYQALSSGTRAILETAIDVVLLTEDPSRWETMYVWEASARMHHAAAVAKFMENKSAKERDEHEGPIRFYESSRESIDQERVKQGWVKTDKNGKQKPYHPGRWTAKDLLADARAADKVVGGRFSFEAFYETRYRELCYFTHGSATAFRLVRNPEIFSFVGGRCYSECADIAMLCAELALQYLNDWSPEVDQLFDRARKERTLREFGVRREMLGLPMDPSIPDPTGE